MVNKPSGVDISVDETKSCNRTKAQHDQEHFSAHDHLSKILLKPLSEQDIIGQRVSFYMKPNKDIS